MRFEAMREEGAKVRKRTSMVCPRRLWHYGRIGITLPNQYPCSANNLVASFDMLTAEAMRFGIDPGNKATASRLIRETVEAGMIVPYDPEAAPKLALRAVLGRAGRTVVDG